MIMFPKPKDIKKEPIHVRTFRDGRENCNMLTKAGRDEYMRRIRAMWERQGKLCCLCQKRLALADATFEHQDGRGHGGGNRDDRIEKDGNPYNGAAHTLCNIRKGSKRIDYNEIII